MRIAEINGGVFGSTGNIMFGVADALAENGHEVVCFSPVTTTNRHDEPDRPYVKIGGFFSRRANVFYDMMTGQCGGAAVFATARLISRLKRFSPDAIHLHVIHGSYVNIPMLFGYIRRNNIRLFWTLHDCWAFTGHCPHYESAGCDKWMTECRSCPLYREYPKSIFDNSGKMFRFKKKLLTGMKDLTLVTPSEYLAGEVGRSFLSELPVRVINNGIDLDIFRPSDQAEAVREKYGVAGKKIIFGAAFEWSRKKGADVFARLASELGGDYAVVLAGTSKETEKTFPDSIVAIRRTRDRNELAALYSAADVFVNPSREETFPTVNIEALACGTPVVTFDAGGSPEIIDASCGVSVPTDDIDELRREIIRVCEEKPYTKEACTLRARRFDKNEKFREYAELISRR